jgi:hypothetical protein
VPPLSDVHSLRPTREVFDHSGPQNQRQHHPFLVTAAPLFLAPFLRLMKEVFGHSCPLHQ